MHVSSSSLEDAAVAEVAAAAAAVVAADAECRAACLLPVTGNGTRADAFLCCCELDEAGESTSDDEAAFGLNEDDDDDDDDEDDEDAECSGVIDMADDG